jgi:plastocyanin
MRVVKDSKGVMMVKLLRVPYLVSPVFFSLVIILITTQPTSSALDIHPVAAVSSNKFTPEQIMINVGDTVQWTNKGGNHSVVADDASFTSGPASPLAWTYDFTFNTPGTFQYYCEIHGRPNGFGMSGIITVQGEPPVLDHFFYLPAILKQ